MDKDSHFYGEMLRDPGLSEEQKTRLENESQFYREGSIGRSKDMARKPEYLAAVLIIAGLAIAAAEQLRELLNQ